MKILIVNDDGFNAEGIRVLYEAALSRGHQVYVSAPSTQCSAKGQCITLFEPLLTHTVLEREGLRVVRVDGMPADCVRVAPHVFGTGFDFCISGINHGENAGTAVMYSGTVAAAREGAMMHLPSIALSLHHRGNEKGMREAARIGLDMAEKLAGADLKRYGVLNINAPAGDPDTWLGHRICPLSDAYFIDRYVKRTNPFHVDYLWLDDAQDAKIEKHPAGSDCALLEDGYVTYTFLGGLNDYNSSLGALLPGHVTEHNDA